MSVLVLLIALIYAWYSCHKRLRVKGYGAGLISTGFVLLLFVCFGIGARTQREGEQNPLPLALWIGLALALTWMLPRRKGAVKDGRVVQLGERQTGKRRALNATIWGWVFTIGGVLLMLFFTWQLISPTIVPRDQGWKAWMASAAFAVIFGQYFFDIVRRSKAAPETLPVSADSVLYLRAFDDEKQPFVFGPKSVLKKYTSQFGAHAPYQRGDPTLKLTLEDYLEEAITAQLGPFVGLGNPYDKMAPDGATREYAPDDQWQSRFLELARSARCIVVSVGGSANLEWELSQLKAEGLAQKVCLFTSPVIPGTDRKLLNRMRRTATTRSEAIAADWTKSREVLARAGFECGDNPGPGAVVTFDEQGNSSILTADANWPPDFITPVADWFKEEKKSGRCVRASCRTCGESTHITLDAVPDAAECYTCRERREHAAKGFLERHPGIVVAWGFVALFVAVVIGQQVLHTNSGWVIVPIWIAIVASPFVAWGALKSRRKPEVDAKDAPGPA